MRTDFAEKHERFNGVQYVWKFQNGYGASVVRHMGSYGGSQGLWELAVLKNGKITYTSGIAEDVIGYLTETKVDKLLAEIESIGKWSFRKLLGKLAFWKRK